MHKHIKNLIILLIATTTFSLAKPLHLKGFHHDIPFKSACIILSSFETQRGEFIMDEANKKCGFGRNGFIAQPYILGDEQNNVKMIRLSPDTVDYLFGVTDQNATTFINLLAKKYEWIDDKNPTMKYSKYKYKDEDNKWEIIINKKKWFDIKFF